MTEQHRATVTRNSLIYVVANVVGHFYVLLTMPFLTRYLGAEEFGFYIILVQLVTITQVLGQALFSQPLLRFYIEYEGEYQKRFVGTVFSAVLLFQTAVAAALYLSRYRVLPALYPNLELGLDPYLMLACVWSILISMRSLSATFIKVREKPAGLIVQNLVYGVLLIFGIAVLVAYRARGLVGALEALILAELGAQIYIVSYLRGALIPAFKLDYIRRCIRFSVPLLGSSFAFLVFVNMDRIILSRYVTLAELGVYGFGLMIGNMAAMVVSAFVSSYTPRMISVAKQEGDAASGSLLQRLIEDNLILLGLTASLLFIGNDMLVRLLGRGEIYSAASLVIVGVATGHLVRSVYLFFQNALFYQNRTKVILALNLFALGAGFGLAQILGAWGGMYGMAFLQASVYVLSLPVGYYLLARTAAGVRVPRKALLGVFATIAALIVLEFLAEKTGRSFARADYWMVKGVEVTMVVFVFGKGAIRFLVRGYAG